MSAPGTGQPGTPAQFGATRAGITVFAPATVSNVGPGFDCFGFALEHPGDTVHARLSRKTGVRIVSIEGDGGKLPLEVERNTAGEAARRVWEGFPAVAAALGLELHLEKGLPGGSGLGSSAASAVAAAVAAMQLAAAEAGAPYDEAAVLEAALAGETVASGGRHADNVAPALLGGFVIVQDVSPLRYARFEPALDCRVAVVTPDIEIATREARAALPRQVPLAGAVANWSNAAALVLGLVQGDRELVARSVEDALVEPHRARLIPGYETARRAALRAGAFACAISGSGPTLFALAPADAVADAVAEAMARVFLEVGHQSRRWVSRISPLGARLV